MIIKKEFFDTEMKKQGYTYISEGVYSKIDSNGCYFELKNTALELKIISINNAYEDMIDDIENEGLSLNEMFENYLK